MPNCLFCKFAKNSPEQGFVYEDEYFVAFLDISQMTEGHTLVIPRKHHRWVWDLPNIGQYFEVCQKIAARIQETYNVEQVYTLTMGSMVPHAHVHLIPKTEGKWYQVLEKVGTLQTNRVDVQKLKEITEKLKHD